MTDARPVIRPHYDFELVAGRLAEAGMTLLALPASGTRPAGYRCFWPAVEGAQAGTPREAPPSARRISEMDQALGWIGLIPDEHLKLRKLVGSRSLSRLSWRTGNPEALLSWKQLGAAMGCSDVTAKTWWVRGVEMIVLRLNRPGLCELLQSRAARHAAEGALRHALDQLNATVGRLELA